MSSEISFKKYLTRFRTEESNNLTHLAFSGGKYNVPENKFDEFYKMYYKSFIKGEEMGIIERTTDSIFSYFLDIESPKGSSFILTINNMKDIIRIASDNISKIFSVSEDNISEYIISKRDINMNFSKYHINFPNLIVDSNIAQLLTKNIIVDLDNELSKVVDFSVYRTGLRLFGSQKSVKDYTKERETYGDNMYEVSYKVFDLDSKMNLDITYDLFMKMSIKVKSDIKMSELNKEYVCNKPITKSVKNTSNVITSVINEEINMLFDAVKDINIKVFENYKGISNIIGKQDKLGIFKYYISIDNYCPFVHRSHKRSESPIYIEINNRGMYIKCHDAECITLKYPEDGLKLPIGFEVIYPNLYMSMTSRYYKSEVKVTMEITKVLEDSLNMSHYKIAKVAYAIYKNRFRIDDIKNADWYEFDGQKWKRTHVMNILLSEDLKKYYRSIKIKEEIEEEVDNSGETKNLEKNMRNELVESIINKLENVSFKKNVLTEMYYLFKSLEPDFMTKLDANPYLMGFKNGVYDLEKGIFRDGEQKDYLTFSTGYDYTTYDPECDEVKEIYSFLSKIIPNKKVLEYLLKVLGRSLIGIPDEHFYIFTGLSGANGKSTLINFLEDTLGDYNTAVDVSLLTNKRGLSASASPDVIRLKGKRIISFAEPEAKDELKVGMMKAMSGGDSIVARELYKAPVAFKLQSSMFLCCNDLPAISSCDGGTFRRLRVINFPSRFCDNPIKSNEYLIDSTIKNKMKHWRPYFMSILIHWYNKQEDEIKRTNKIEEPIEVLVATSKYKDNNNKFTDFFEDCVSESNTIISMKTIYQLFCTWWSNTNINSKIPDNKDLLRAFYIKYNEEDYIKHKGFYVKVNLNLSIDIDNEL